MKNIGTDPLPQNVDERIDTNRTLTTKPRNTDNTQTIRPELLSAVNYIKPLVLCTEPQRRHSEENDTENTLLKPTMTDTSHCELTPKEKNCPMIN